MSSAAEWNITPAAFLTDLGWTYRIRGRWLDVKACPFCQGGAHKDRHTFAVHAEDGNYKCLRASCGEGGNFWKLIEVAGRDPRNYRGERQAKPLSKQKRKFVYGRT